MRGDVGDRVLHVWTPRILRTALACGSALLLTGLCALGASDPGAYMGRYRALQSSGRGAHAMKPELLHQGATRGPGHALLFAGLLVLTLVPIGRVAFTVVVFVVEHDWTFAILTSLVLALLCLGVLLGRMG